MSENIDMVTHLWSSLLKIFFCRQNMRHLSHVKWIHPSYCPGQQHGIQVWYLFFVQWIVAASRVFLFPGLLSYDCIYMPEVLSLQKHVLFSDSLFVMVQKHTRCGIPLFKNLIAVFSYFFHLSVHASYSNLIRRWIIL